MLRTTALAAVAALATWTAPAAEAQAPLTTELVVQGLTSPTDVAAAPGDNTRLFVVQRGGQVRVIENDVLLATPFLDIDPIVQSGGEQGLLGIAFHPDYQNNGRFFLNYTTNGGATRVSEFAVTADPNVASPTVVQTIAAISQDFSNHNGGCIQFGPDGMLYVGMGDGGSGNDPNNRAQTLSQRLGKMLRYDVDLPIPFIPADNPFVGTPGVPGEIWMLGLRNPWRFSFDRMTGDLWIGDVGQGQREEIDFIPAGTGSGGNLGWRCLEGTRCTGLSGCSCTDTSLIPPIQEYTHSGGNCSITGGYVYRGAAIPSLQGTYFYADFCSNKIWSLEYDGMNVQNFVDRTLELRPQTGGSITGISTFGEDGDGEMYIATLSGRLYRIIEEPPACEATNFCTPLPTAQGFPALIGSGGSTEIGNNDFTLFASGVPTGQFGLFFYGPEETQVASGAGNLCIAGNASTGLVRLPQILQADIFGGVFTPIDLTDPIFVSGPAPITPGSTWKFQFWFRDVDPAGNNTWNYTDGLSVLFCP